MAGRASAEGPGIISERAIPMTVDQIRAFHQQWHAAQAVSFEPSCETCFLLRQLAEAQAALAEAIDELVWLHGPVYCAITPETP